MSEFIEKIKSAGIVGAGGAGFPTHVKLDAQAEYVLVNGAECEPLLRVDQILMAKETDKILKALDRCVEEVGAKEGVIALKEKYTEAIEEIKKRLPVYPKLRIHLLKNVYPAGDEQYIVEDVTKRIVPEGGIPLMVGCIVINVETLLNISHALEDKPLTEKYLTITGHVRKPTTLKVPLGISVREAIELAGGTDLEEFKVIDGGPMMGKILYSIDIPIKKTSKGYIVLPKDHGLITSKEKTIATQLKEAKTSCCHCDLCTDVCPRYLLGHNLHPSKIMRIASYGNMGDSHSRVDEVFLCCECGLCEQACIMNLQPWKVNIFLKAQLTQQGIKNTNHRAELEIHPFKEYREFPTKKLVYRLDLQDYDRDTEWVEKKDGFSQVIIGNKQHIGVPSNPVVEDGDHVQKGDLLFEAQDKMAVNMHASIEGRVKIHQNKVIITRQGEED